VHILHIHHILHIYAKYAAYLKLLHIFLHSVHLCIIERLKRNLVAVCLLSDSDSDGEPINPALDNDDQAPGDDSQAGAGPGSAALPGPTTTCPCLSARATGRHAQDNASCCQPAGGPNIKQVMRDIDADMGPNPDPIPSERCGGESRRASIKRKASGITRSTAEVYALLTSRTSSIEEAAEILECFGNVSLCALHLNAYIALLFIYSILMHILHIFKSNKYCSPPSRQRTCHIAP
jgi:hypothetical protein